MVASNTISEDIDECLAAIADQVSTLQAATSTYRGRRPDWGDVASLREVRRSLSTVLTGLGSAGAAADLKRAAGEVAIEVRRLRGVDQGDDRGR